MPLATAKLNAGSVDDLATVIGEMAIAVLVLDAAGVLVRANNHAHKMLGCTSYVGLPVDELFAACGVEGGAVLPEMAGDVTSARMRLSDGCIVNVQAKRLSTGGAVLTLEDVSALVRDAERAHFDGLTGLVNRVALHTELHRRLRDGLPIAVVCLDLDRFKPVNDTLGHPIGDVLLRKVAERLLSVAGEDDVVARLGGDEFAIIRSGVERPEDAQAFAARLVDLIGRTYVLEGHMLNIGASVGVAIASDGRDSDTLLKNADLALYRAKGEGRGTFRFFEPEMDARMQRRRALELDLRRALALKELHLVYQPQFRLDPHYLVGFEALLRWENPERGFISPAEFIPLAEEIGLIVPIGEWVMRTACREAAAWSEPVTVAVNLSPLQFRNPKLVETVASALAHSGLEPSRLELEITEGALLDNTEIVVRMLNRLKALGVRVSMDDFGTGYSSLSYLQKFPFDKIKIDQSFVRGMSDNAECSAIVRAVASLGASLGMKTTAEGVETQEQLDAIRAQGCSEVQGYLTGRPLSAEAASALLHERHHQRTE